MQQLLFVCTGNTCRSPMAMAILNHLVQHGRLQGVTAQSAGIYASGEPASPNAVAVLKKHGILLQHYRSHPLTHELILQSSKIYAMTPQHRQLLLQLGAASEKVLVLGGGIADPYGGDLNAYEACYNQIYSSICSLFGVPEE